MEKKVLDKLRDIRDQVPKMDNRELELLYRSLCDYDIDDGILGRLRGYCSAIFEDNNLLVVVKGEKKTVRIRYDYCNGFYYKKICTVSVGDKVKLYSGEDRRMSEDDVVREIITMNV